MTASIRISSRAQRVKPSITLAITAKAASLRAEGHDVVSFGAGQPDFDTPAHIKEAARHALDNDPSVAKYTSVRGIAPLCKAVAETLSATHGIDVTPDRVLVSCGAKHSLFNTFQATLDAGDEVIIPSPYWVSYPAMVGLAEGTPVIVPTAADNGFLLEPEDLRAAITDKTRALVLNTPSNPTGALYDRARLEAIASMVLEHDLFVISDDIYRSLVYGDAVYHSIASLSPEVAARTIIIDGVSKSYAMTGWRIGFTAGPADLIAAMAKIQGQSTSNASHIAQVAALAAITGPQECIAEMREAFDERRKEMVKLLTSIDGVTCVEPAGAFYAFPDFSAYVGKKTPKSQTKGQTGGQVIGDDVALCEYLLRSVQVAIVPGTGFGAPGFARLSYACSMDDIRSGLGRIKEALSALT